MVLVKAGEIAIGIGGGAAASELLRLVIGEAERVRSFKSVYKELASVMTKLRDVLIEIELLQKENDLVSLMDTIRKARDLVRKCSGVKWWNIIFKSYYSRKIEKINKKMLKFCQVQLQLLSYRNQLRADIKLDRLADPAPVYTDRCSVPKLAKVLVGLDGPLADVKMKILDDSVDSLVVSAPPGCGKTTLVTHLCNDATITGKFTHIFFCVVSSNPNFRVIVQNLFLQNRYQALTFDDDTQARVALRTLMEKLKADADGPILLVLDDVWHGEISFLQNFQIGLSGFKILVTSRSGFPTLSSTYDLKPLEYEDARKLLIQWATRPKHASQAEYENILQKILKHCNGLPLVIEVFGVSLKGKDLYVWEAQVESWFEGHTILDNRDVMACLQPSFDTLEPNLRKCFMDMGSFLEDQKTRASVIVDIWVELYTEDCKICMKYLDDLASRNLLNLIPLGGNGPTHGFYNDFIVTQHDILRELAIRQSKFEEENLETNQKRLNLEIRGDNYPGWYLNLKEPIKASLLSVSTDNLFSSKWVEMDCPNVEALVLNLSSSNYELPNFITTMKKLKVVIIINHGPNPAKLTNLECLQSLPNLKRIRMEKVSITLIQILQLQLQTLEKLSLVMCSFGKVSHDTKAITDVSKALPSLHEIDIDYCYDLVELPNWVSEIFSLKTLSITNCNKLTKLPEAVGKLSVLEVLRLTSCINLSELPQATERLSNLQFLDISDCLGMKKLPLEIGNLQRLKKISMRKCWRCELPDSVTKLEDLVVKCDEDTSSQWKRLKPNMINLEVHEEEIEHNLNMFKMFEVAG